MFQPSAHGVRVRLGALADLARLSGDERTVVVLSGAREGDLRNNESKQ